jgi:hypothetical protein
LQNFISGKVYNIVCKEHSLPEFPEMLFGVSNDNGLVYFNASAYLKSKGQDLKLTKFFSDYKAPIEALQEAYTIKDDEVCRLNQDGDFTIEVDFLYLFICFTDHQFMGHINERINDLFSMGFAVSDTYLYRSCCDRFPSDVIARMANGKDRKQNA